MASSSPSPPFIALVLNIAQVLLFSAESPNSEKEVIIESDG